MSIPTILLFLKAPIPGYVKTRLARSVGNHKACGIYQALVRRQIEALPPSWPLEIHFTPAENEARIRRWISGADGYFPQVEGDLGDRLAAASDSVFLRKSAPAFLIGTDCPDLDKSTFYRALAALAEGNDLVFGPARDGGYYLLALKRFEPALFQGIPWSTSQVLERSLHKARQSGLKTFLLDPKEDIDDWDSFQRAGLGLGLEKESPESIRRLRTAFDAEF